MKQVVRILSAYRDELEREISFQENELKVECFDFMVKIRKRRIARSRKFILDTNDAIKLLNEVKTGEQKVSGTLTRESIDIINSVC
jgi:hypothetical protein